MRVEEWHINGWHWWHFLVWEATPPAMCHSSTHPSYMHPGTSMHVMSYAKPSLMFVVQGLRRPGCELGWEGVAVRLGWEGVGVRRCGYEAGVRKWCEDGVHEKVWVWGWGEKVWVWGWGEKPRDQKTWVTGYEAREELLSISYPDYVQSPYQLPLSIQLGVGWPVGELLQSLTNLDRKTPREEQWIVHN